MVFCESTFILVLVEPERPDLKVAIYFQKMEFHFGANSIFLEFDCFGVCFFS